MAGSASAAGTARARCREGGAMDLVMSSHAADRGQKRGIRQDAIHLLLASVRINQTAAAVPWSSR